MPVPTAATPAPPVLSGTTVTLVATAEESVPFRLNPAFISLGLPRSAFATQVGGEPAVQAAGTLQDGWRQCRRCLGMVFTREATPGRCSAGGDHQTVGLGVALQFGEGGDGMEAGWRHCAKCHGLAFTGGAPGPCPAGGQHEAAGSGSLVLRLGTPARGQQGGWRRCSKCQGLALTNGRPGGACPAGGMHETAGSQAYVVGTAQAVVARPPRQGVLKPQLFLVEHYQLSNFSGALLRDQLVATMQALLPRQKITCRVLTRRRTSQEEKQGSTVIDAQSTEASTSFNNQVKEASRQAFGSEEYDYAMQANFNGKGSMGFGKASAKARLDVSGSTNTVRNELASSVDSALDNQVNQANQARQESVRVASSESKVETTNETETIVVTENPTDQVLNFGIYQIKQEHISILSLVDAEVTFLNGDPTATRRVPLFRLGELLNEVIADPEEREAIRAQVRDCLSSVRDNNDRAQSLIQDDPVQPGSVIINKRLRSTYELRNADGSVRQVLSAPGIILRAATKHLKKPGATVVATIQ
ncbi:hypothetical protein EXY23_24715 [Roseicella aquatilis]|uniref:Uncharacterized protein n=2 Tax=Roseicella aquatilis TaxID=2527868 RepID=A0A4R4D2Y8_9PROT|nr:hypothetical protein EXY23_24715 [Roseicella aquatilis]